MQSMSCTSLAIALWWATASASLANEDIWKTSASGVWGVGSNWLDGSTPGNGDTATFISGSYTVTFNADPLAIQKLTLIGTVTFTSSSFLLPSTVRVTSGDSPNVVIGEVFSTGVLTLGSAGGITQPDKPLHLTAAGWVSVLGRLNVRFGSQVNATVGNIDGTLSIAEGSRVMTTSGLIGYGWHGRADVTGNGSQWINSGLLTIGSYEYFDPFGTGLGNVGDGALLISGGGLVQDLDAKVGDGSEALGTAMTGTVGVVTVMGTGSLWRTINNLDIGVRANGSVGIQAGGTVRVGGQTSLHSGGRLRLQGGTFETGTLTLNGGTLEFEIGSPAQTTVTGQALLIGQLDLKLINGVTPSPGQTFVIMTAGSISGAFANAANGQRVITSDGGGSFLVHYGVGSAFDPTLMVLSDFQVGGIPGDFDEDGDVDRDDLLQWQGDFLQNDLSDADDDGDSDGEDFLMWQRNLSGPAVPAATIPEPAAGELALVSALGLLIPHTRRKPC